MVSEKMIAGVWSGHDSSYCVLDGGRPVIHDEYERFIREKEPAGDSVRFLLDNFQDCDSLKYIATCTPTDKLASHKESLIELNSIISKNGGGIYSVGHHQAHAANTFFSSNFEEALILTMDGGGVEIDNFETAFTVWTGKGNEINCKHRFPINILNIGGLWTRSTRYIFELQSGWPLGHQAGSVMAMAALGDKEKYVKDFYIMLTEDIQAASFKPPNQPKGALILGNDPKHPYLDKWNKIARKSEQDKFDLAAGLQYATEIFFKDLMTQIIGEIPQKNLCLAGGVSLNCVLVGKIKEWFPHIENIFATTVPHDGGIAIGAAQYVWHQVLKNERIKWKDNFTPYLGKTYSEQDVMKSISDKDGIEIKKVSDNDVIDLLYHQKIISVFGQGSESGRRALGNRSILADPRSSKMKEIINDKVKHRQWYRPFAPSILEEEGKNWFENYQESPYMSFALRFKEEKKELVPAVVHVDGTARLQTVTINDNNWYYNFLKMWHKKSGVPILLNTSFNDREPICETPEHALKCFLRTDIDFLYFYDYGFLLSKVGK